MSSLRLDPFWPPAGHYTIDLFNPRNSRLPIELRINLPPEACCSMSDALILSPTFLTGANNVNFFTNFLAKETCVELTSCAFVILNDESASDNFQPKEIGRLNGRS